jgi:hypothetical protein
MYGPGILVCLSPGHELLAHNKSLSILPSIEKYLHKFHKISSKYSEAILGQIFGQRILHDVVPLMCLFFRCKNFKSHHSYGLYS